MRPVRLACALLLSGLLAFAGASPAAAQDGTPIVTGASHALPSRIFGGAREINVWLPPGYAKDATRYPVLYVLDGGLDQDFGHIAGLADLGALSWTFETFIVVGVRTQDRRRELTPPPADPRYTKAFPQAGGAADFRRFLTQEAIPFVEGRYRTAPRRTLMGESLAGLFVVDTFLHSPQAFQDYIAVSPSLWWDDKAPARDAAAALARHAPSERRLYLAIADEGGTMGAAMDTLVRTLRARPPAGLQWTFRDFSTTETHATIYHAAALDALRTLYKLPPYDTGPTHWYMIEGAGPP